MRKPSRKFLAYTAAGRTFAVFARTLLRAAREAETIKEEGEEILAVVEASCTPISDNGTPDVGERPFFAILLWNPRHAQLGQSL